MRTSDLTDLRFDDKELRRYLTQASVASVAFDNPKRILTLLLAASQTIKEMDERLDKILEDIAAEELP